MQYPAHGNASRNLQELSEDANKTVTLLNVQSACVKSHFCAYKRCCLTILLLINGSVIGSKLAKLYLELKKKYLLPQIQKSCKWTMIQTGWMSHIKGKHKVINHVCLVNEEFAPAFLHVGRSRGFSGITAHGGRDEPWDHHTGGFGD